MIKHHVKEEEKRSEGLFAQASGKPIVSDFGALGQRLQTQGSLDEAVRRRQPASPPKTRARPGHKLVQAELVEGSRRLATGLRMARLPRSTSLGPSGTAIWWRRSSS